jgi:cold shock CspA family protein
MLWITRSVFGGALAHLALPVHKTSVREVPMGTGTVRELYGTDGDYSIASQDQATEYDVADPVWRERFDGSLLWFNDTKNVGVIAAGDGERLHVDGTAFPGGKGINGRCRGTAVSFEVVEGPAGRTAVAVSLTPVVAPRRARRHTR